MPFWRDSEEKSALFEIRWLLKGLQMMQLLSFPGDFVFPTALTMLPMVAFWISISSFPRKPQKGRGPCPHGSALPQICGGINAAQ